MDCDITLFYDGILLMLGFVFSFAAAILFAMLVGVSEGDLYK